MSDTTTNIEPIKQLYAKDGLYNPEQRVFAVPEGLAVYVEDMSMQDWREFPDEYCYMAHLMALRQMRSASGAHIPIAANFYWPELIFWLPGVSDEELVALSHTIPDTMCHASADLLTSRPVLVWKTTAGTELCVHEWIHGLYDVNLRTVRGFSATFMNEQTIKYSSYHLSPAAAIEFDEYMHVHHSMSRDYCPKRIWGEQKVESHKWLVYAPRPDLIVPVALPEGQLGKTLWALNRLKQYDDI
jgi:hypothetical protein